MARLHVLGAGGHAATLSRQTACFLIETRRSMILVGAGSGVSRLQDPWLSDLRSRVPRAVVLVPSLRHDFLGGLPELPQWIGNLEVALVAAPEAASAPLDSGLGRWLDRPFLREDRPAWLERLGTPAEMSQLRVGRNRVLGESIQTMVGPDGQAAFRLREVVFALDQAPHEALAAFADKASALVVSSGDPATGEETVRAWASFALRTGVRDLLLAHHHPGYDAESLDALLFAASTVFPRTVLASDMSFLKLAGVGDEEDEETPESGAVTADDDDDDDDEDDDGESFDEAAPDSPSS